jgi:hypothetical protein
VRILPIVLVALRATTNNVKDENNCKNYSTNGNSDVERSKIAWETLSVVRVVKRFCKGKIMFLKIRKTASISSFIIQLPYQFLEILV